MEYAARRFARRILIAHLFALVFVVALVLAAAREAYLSTRQEVLAQAQRRQELLAAQTARGIENFYTSLLAQLDLLKQTEETKDAPVATGSPARQAWFLAPVLWNQLSGSVSHLFVVDRLNRAKVVTSFGDERTVSTQDIATAIEDWLKSVEGPAVSGYHTLLGQGVTLAAVPVAGEYRRLIVAVVPIEQIERRFLDTVNQDAQISATLLDDSGATMATSDPHLVGFNVKQDVDRPELRALASEIVGTGKRHTQVIEQPTVMGGIALSPRMITAEPISLSGREWSVLIATPLAEVDAVIGSTFNRALVWAIFVIVSMTAILVSTAVQLIRSGTRLERVQREILEQELDHARRIQLAWLPPNNATAGGVIDIAAINQPASHISGDFYNWFELPDGRTVVTIGDVTGHGMSAAFLMATTQLLIRTTMLRVGDPARCLGEVNRHLCGQVFGGQFVTLLILVIDADTGRLEAATAGHPPPLLGNGDAFELLNLEPQLVLGVESEWRYRTQRFELGPRSSLLLYTDGASETQSPQGEWFGTEGLLASLSGTYDSAQSLLDAALAAVNDFRGTRDLSDDLTLVALQLQGTIAEPEPTAALV